MHGYILVVMNNGEVYIFDQANQSFISYKDPTGESVEENILQVQTLEYSSIDIKDNEMISASEFGFIRYHKITYVDNTRKIRR
jgi:hypothetical protein